jgi:hypothetical protein
MSYLKKALQMAIFFHNKYEELASEYGYETRLDTRVFDKNSVNGKLMIAVCMEWLNEQEKQKQ